MTSGSWTSRPRTSHCWGRSSKNIIFHHLKQRGGDLTYFRDDESRECDFLREADDGSFEAIQVCYDLNDENSEREIGGLLAALNHFNLDYGLIITARQRDTAVFEDKTIDIIPATEFL